MLKQFARRGAASGLSRRRRPLSTSVAELPSAETGDASKAGGSKRRALPPPLVVTPTAASRINDLVSNSSGDVVGVLLGVKRRGCNGMSYTLNYADAAPPKTHERIECDGAIVWIEPPALFHIASRPRPLLFLPSPRNRPRS